MTPIIITGCAGRMGQALVSLVRQSKDLDLVGLTEAAGSPMIGKMIDDRVVADSLSSVRAKKAVVIDFTAPEATCSHVQTALSRGWAMVIGTTGMSDQDSVAVKQASKKIPVVMAPNMSVGVNTLFKLAAEVASILGSGYEIEILEAHHRHKKDAPSGTAVKLAEILAEATGRKYPGDFIFHRQGNIGERDPKKIGIQTIRGGDIVGEHTVFYCGEGERLELKHVATSRATFAGGALRAARWVFGRSSGFYSMQDVLGICR